MKIVTMLYGLTCYAVSMLMLVLFMLFANNHMSVLGLDNWLGLNIDQTHIQIGASALLVNIGLLLAFGVQHSVMARASFKKMLTSVIPEAWERSTYLLATAGVLYLTIWYWQAMPSVLWHVEGEMARNIITAIYYSGWLITVLATFMLNHFHLFGLQQSFKSDDPDAGVKEFKTPMFYSLVRHPIQTGVVIAMFATPDMTVGRAVLAVGMLVYIGIGLYYEEKDLIDYFGDTYREYKARVPALLPFKKG